MFSSNENPSNTETNEANIHLQQLRALSAFIDGKITEIISLNLSVAANYIDELCQELNSISAEIHELEKLIMNVENQFIEDPKRFYQDNNQKFNKIISDILLKNNPSSIEEIEKLENELEDIYSNLYKNLVTLLDNLNKFYPSVAEIISSIQTLSIKEIKKEQIQRAINSEEVSTAVIEALAEMNAALLHYTDTQFKDLSKELLEKCKIQDTFKRQLEQLPENIGPQYRDAKDKLDEQKALLHQQRRSDQSSSSIMYVTRSRDTQLPSAETEVTEASYSDLTLEAKTDPDHSSHKQTPSSSSTGKIIGTLFGAVLGFAPGSALGFAIFMLLISVYDGIKFPIELAIALGAFIGSGTIGGAGLLGGHILDKSRDEKRKNEDDQLVTRAPTSEELETLSSNNAPDIEESSVAPLTYTP